ncbi:MAG: hypothetical protein UR69_C0001G0135 [Candidatus Moranbacteria bacterium GW2011_GWE2_35_2-]|nr:MAG: hypothetical protein UR69_C0001G0135 [Candidatus Moranbacteria bacterium GW2011_GWE2_35_2-]KKQ04269.1 MAG: hypothetical protein US15_C0063G0002 [Candidatus Moranbacteria bacterium GW2011_GWF1_36_4]KKQ22867.1 MAG: hypothetical protein US37_C0001G0139 [Candidatus Moranbacteria bacterium GW2011_GWF2_37_11]KKQ29225.1 MAG: hypothetical protein US44_C0002G0007 [Candidatus Moranbacteria bacterium GW2011_GWD1_37_17]KKQ30902.1 MAG: hypothetical protein US47_C0001G0135 [Candidatus Moranbacteria b
MKKIPKKIEFVKNSEKYYEFMRLLRNDTIVQKGFIEQVNITPAQQVEYMKKYKENYYICLVDGNPAGFIGTIDGDIRIATHPKYQGNGIGLFMVKELMKKNKNIQAKIKIDNNPSMKLFEKAGFKLKYYIFEP